ncbi:MAG: glycosyltransferase [Chitinophagaceae bacterium]
MSNIVFIVDAEEGHVIPSFGLARSLKERGHHIVYLSIIDNEELVKEQGFEFYPIFEDIYYKGYRNQYKKLSLPPGVKQNGDRKLQNAYSKHVAELMNGKLDGLLEQLRADLYIINTFLQTDILILHYKFKINPVVLTPFLRESGRTLASDCFEYLTNVDTEEINSLIEFLETCHVNIQSLTQLATPFNSFCEIVVCPRELEIDDHAIGLNVHHIEPSIRKSTGGQNVFSLFQIPANKKIIYGSMGSQPVRHGETCRLFFEKIISALQSQELADCHLVLSIGPEFSIESLGQIPPNVSIARWVPQIDILKVAAAAIIHGGLGSVKECIYYGVPIIVFPLGFDQPLNAKRVAHHKLGIAADIGTVSVNEIRSYLLEVMTNEEIKISIRKMQSIFQEKESLKPGVTIVENMLANQNKRSEEIVTLEL